MADLLAPSSRSRSTAALTAVLQARPAQGLAREGRPSSSSRTPTSPSAAAPTSTTRPPIDDPRVDDVRILRPQEIPRYVAEGLFDLGITGRDWIEETGSDVVTLGELQLLEGHRPPDPHRASPSPPTRRASAVERPARRACGCSTEYPELTRRFFEEHGIDADIRLSYGATEAKVPDIVDCVVDITETGRALRAAGLQDHRHDPRRATPS